jgi:hypothetical protein
MEKVYEVKRDGSLVIIIGLKDEFPSYNWDTDKIELMDDSFVLDSYHPNTFPTMLAGLYAIRESNPNFKEWDCFRYNDKIITQDMLNREEEIEL